MELFPLIGLVVALIGIILSFTSLRRNTPHRRAVTMRIVAGVLILAGLAGFWISFLLTY